jgi:DNA-binding NarL/FixJ family response regulator
VAESTVKTHVKHILRKLGVSNRAQAISQFLSV